jgi:hypothetical protein
LIKITGFLIFNKRTSATTGSAIEQTYNEVIPTGIYDMVEHVNGQKYPAKCSTFEND